MNYNTIEKILRQHNATYLKTLQLQMGQKIWLYKAAKNKFSRVYGDDSGENRKVDKDIVGIVVGDDFFAASRFATSDFSEGWLFTSDKRVKAGDEIRLKRGDKLSKGYQVSGPFDLGMTDVVFSKFKLASLGD